MTVVVTHSTPADSSFSTTGATAWNATHTLSGVGTMAGQDANTVAITGGAIDGTTVGATTPTTGAFTYANFPSQSVAPATPSTGFTQYAASTGMFSWKGTNGFIRQFDASGITADRTWVLPNTAGTIALTSNLGTIASQNANAVTITGGSINGTTVGATTASTGAFTTLSASSTVSGAGFDTYLASPPAIGGTTAAAGTFTTLISNSTAQFGKSSVNYLQAVGGATTVAPALTVQSSSDTNVDFSIKALGTGSTLIGTGNGTAIAAADSGATIAWWQFTGTATSTGNMIARVGGGGTNTSLISVAKGTGTIQFATNNTATTVQMQVSNTTSAVNYVQVTGAATGGTPAISAQGSDAAVSLNLISKSTGVIRFYTATASSEQFRVTHTAGTIVNYATATGAIAGAGPIFSVAGTDADIDLNLTPKGAGNVRFGTYTVSALLAVAGYITIKDSGGTTRRLLVG
jgi:hypothetical protein